MKRSNRDSLEDLRHEVALIIHFTREGKDAFLQDERTQYAVMMAYARIGEIAKQIPDDIFSTQPQVEWRELKGFRDVLIHRYFDINLERVWAAVEKLSDLQRAIDALLANLPVEESDS